MPDEPDTPDPANDSDPDTHEEAFTNRPRCPYCKTMVIDPDKGTDSVGSYETRCSGPECGAWLEIVRDVIIELHVRDWSRTVPPRVFLGP